MIDVGVRRQDEVDRCGGDGKLSRVLPVGLGAPLEHPAVDEEACAAGADEDGGAGDFAGRPQELDGDGHATTRVRAGAFVFRQPVVQHTGEMPGQPLLVSVYPAATSRGSLYEDDGGSLAYTRGVYSRRRFSQTRDARGVTIEASTIEGRYRPAPRDLVLTLVGETAAVRQFIEWFAPRQYGSGKVPCCVDARGADPVPEHDSNGELVFLLAA